MPVNLIIEPWRRLSSSTLADSDNEDVMLPNGDAVSDMRSAEILYVPALTAVKGIVLEDSAATGFSAEPSQPSQIAALPASGTHLINADASDGKLSVTS